MERNGLEGRKREFKVGNWVGGISTFFLISFFLVPAYLPTDSVPDLSGRANMFDYGYEDSWGNLQTSESNGVGHNQTAEGKFAWTELDPFAAFIYGFGDLNCHNKADRSWEINGNQMPVCVRDIGIFLGLAIGGFLFSRRGLNRWTIRDSFLSIFPDDRLEMVYRKNLRLKAVMLVAVILVAPMAFDGFGQMLTSYESTATMRLLTGTPFGLFLGLYLSAAFSSKPKSFDSGAGAVLLPAGSKFTLAKPQEEE
jgi:uncharacterized membrane protein